MKFTTVRQATDIKGLLSKGISPKEIAAQLGMSLMTTYYQIRRQKLQYKHKYQIPGAKKLNFMQQLELLQLTREGTSQGEIAKKMRMHRCTVRNYQRALGYRSFSRYSHLKPRGKGFDKYGGAIPLLTQKKIYNLTLQGNKQREIQETLNIGRGTVARYQRRFGLCGYRQRFVIQKL